MHDSLVQALDFLVLVDDFVKVQKVYKATCLSPTFIF